MSKTRTITPNPPADFVPSKNDVSYLRPFRVWCQKVLPLVYDDSLSYYELLCKVVHFLNKTMEEVNQLGVDISNMFNAFQQLQDYVNNYFSTLDVQEEINNKLDEMAENGELANIISTFTYRGYRTTTELINDSKLKNNQFCYTLGYYDINDGGSALIYTTDTKNENLFSIETTNGLFANIIPQNGLLNVKACGAYGDDEHDDSEVINSVLEFGGVYNIEFPQSFYKGNINITKLRTKINGNHSRIHGKITISNDEIIINELDTEDTDGYAGGYHFISGRYVNINNCYFYACNKGITVNDEIFSISNRHSIGLVNINNCSFLNCDYGIYIEYPYSDDIAAWQKCNDWKIENCYFNNCKINVIYSVGIDGLTFINNTIFNVAGLASRMECIHIINSDQLIISNSSFFNTGREAIKLDYSRTTIISSNDFWGCGDFGYNIINIIYGSNNDANVGRVAITGNDFMYCNNVPIVIKSDIITVNASGNNYLIEHSPNTPSFKLDIDVFMIVDSNTSIITDKCGLPYSKANKLYFGNDLYKKVTIVASTKTKIIDMPAEFVGLLSINVFNDHIGNNVNNATYVYCTALNGTNNGFKELTKAGVINDVDSGSTNWCGFTFSLEDGVLYATPIGVVHGDFVFTFNITNSLQNML